MKKLKKLNLSHLANVDLEKREMNSLLGGGTPGCCSCGCRGSSSAFDNGTANVAGGYTPADGGWGQGPGTVV